MADIKVKKSKKETIKTIDKTVIGTQKLKNKLIETKERMKDDVAQEENASGTNYAINKITNSINNTPYNIGKINRIGQKSYKQIEKNIQEKRQKIEYFRNKNELKNNVKSIKQSTNPKVNEKLSGLKSKNKLKTTKVANQKLIKTSENIEKNINIISSKNKVKANKIRHQAIKLAKETSKNMKLAIKSTISSIKAIILGTKTLILFLFGGFWIVIFIVIIISMIAMLCSSIFGIFFSNEQPSSVIIDGVSKEVTMSDIISSLNNEFMDKIITIQRENPYEEYDITGERADWKDILAIYSAKVSNGNNDVEMMTLDENKINMLKEIFWKMNDVSFTKDEEKEEILIFHLTSTETKVIKHTKLHIKISGKSADDLMNEYIFTNNQREQFAELTSNEYTNMWTSVIYGNTTGNNDIVQVALSQVGNVGGEPYWSWYGFNTRVEWCAVFVSWCANECGYIKSGIIPKFASCENEGVSWFKTCGLWKDKNYIPKSRRYNIL